jgi:hypothetical protein
MDVQLVPEGAMMSWLKDTQFKFSYLSTLAMEVCRTSNSLPALNRMV